MEVLEVVKTDCEPTGGWIEIVKLSIASLEFHCNTTSPVDACMLYFKSVGGIGAPAKEKTNHFC